MRKLLIRLLGGVAKEDHHMAWSDYHRAFSQGEVYALHKIQEYMRECYGDDAETWADSVWKFILHYREEKEAEV